MTTTLERTVDPVLQTLGGVSVRQQGRDIFGTRLYDHILASSLTEIPEILAAAAETSGAVLELSWGSGRLSRRIGSTGRESLALRPSKRGSEQTFGCVILGASYATLLDPDTRRTLFRMVNRCLVPGGRFLMTVLNPDHRHGPITTNNGATILQLGEDAFLITVESRDALNGARHVTMTHIGFNEHGTYRSSASSSDISFVSTGLIEEDLAAEGLTVLERRPVRADKHEERIKELNLWVCALSQRTQKAKDRL